jgi:Flp pilus assembly protein TadD
MRGAWIVVLAAFVFTVLGRNIDYQSDAAFWCPESQRHPKAYDASIGCAQGLRFIGDLDAARRFYERSLAMKHPATKLVSIQEYGLVLASLQMFGKAAQTFRAVRSIDPTFQNAWANEAACYKKMGKIARAKSLLREGELIVPQLKDNRIYQALFQQIP